MVDHRAHRARALLAIYLLMSMHSPLMSFRTKGGVNQMQVDVNAVTLSSSPERFVKRPSPQVAADRNESDLVGTAMTVPNESTICEEFRHMTAYFSDKSRLLNAIFDAYSGGLITHHAVHVWNSLRGFYVDRVVSFTDTVIGSFQLWLGSLWVLIDVMTNICDKTLGTCVGIVNLLSLLLCIVFITIFFFPVFCAAVAAHAGLGALTAWLGTHLGHMVLSMILLVWRKILANICAVIEDGSIVIRRVLTYVREEADNLVQDWRRRTGHRFESATVLEAVRIFRVRDNRLAAYQAAQEALNRQMLRTRGIAQIHAQAWDATRRSWKFAMSGMSLTHENRGNLVDEGELTFSPRGNSSVLGRWSSR